MCTCMLLYTEDSSIAPQRTKAACRALRCVKHTLYEENVLKCIHPSWRVQGIDGLILVAPAVVAPLFSSSSGPSNSGLCRKEANSMSATFEGPEKVQASKER